MRTATPRVGRAAGVRRPSARLSARSAGSATSPGASERSVRGPCRQLRSATGRSIDWSMMSQGWQETHPSIKYCFVSKNHGFQRNPPWVISFFVTILEMLILEVRHPKRRKCRPKIQRLCAAACWGLLDFVPHR